MALTLDDDQAAALLELLGLPADTTDIDTLLATVKDAVMPTDGKPSDVAAAAKRAGLEVIDADTITVLRRDAAEGRQVKAAAELQRVENLVGDAVKAGKIGPGRTKHWVTLIQNDPGMADVLASVPDNTVPLAEVGHGVSGDEQDQRDEWFH